MYRFFRYLYQIYRKNFRWLPGKSANFFHSNKELSHISVVEFTEVSKWMLGYRQDPIICDIKIFHVILTTPKTLYTQHLTASQTPYIVAL